MVKTTFAVKTQGGSGPVIAPRATPFNPRIMPMQSADFMPGVRSLAKSLSDKAEREAAAERQRQQLAMQERLQQARISANKAAAEIAFRRESDRRAWEIERKRATREEAREDELAFRQRHQEYFDSEANKKLERELRKIKAQRSATSAQDNPFSGADPADIAERYNISPARAEIITKSPHAGKQFYKEVVKIETRQTTGNQVVGLFDHAAQLIQSVPPEISSQVFGIIRGNGLTADLRDLRGASREASTLYRKLQGNMKAIQAQMQRILLKGGGSITENERKSINEIFGNIFTSRDPSMALELLQEGRFLAGNFFLKKAEIDKFKPYVAPTGAGGGSLRDLDDNQLIELIQRKRAEQNAHQSGIEDLSP